MNTLSLRAKIIIGIISLAVLIVGLMYLLKPGLLNVIVNPMGLDAERPQVVEEKLVIPQTEKITSSETRAVPEGTVSVKLVPQNDGEKVVVEKAVLTVKGSYELAKMEAEKWSSDARLALVKSLGAVTLEGKSSQWQAIFSSSSKKGKGYEVIIQADQIVSKKEISSNIVGADVPSGLKDSQAAVYSLQLLPQFSDATISSINLYYNTDGKVWRYTLATSRGGTSMSATD